MVPGWPQAWSKETQMNPKQLRSSPHLIHLIIGYASLFASLSSCTLFIDFDQCQQDSDCKQPLSFCAPDHLCKQHNTTSSLPQHCRLTAGKLAGSKPVGMLLPLSGPQKPFGEGLFLSAELALETIQRDFPGTQTSLIACDSYEMNEDEIIQAFYDLKTLS